MTINSFGPISDASCRVLILGSIPGVASLRKGEYYGHEKNGFWRIIYALFAEEYEESYVERTRFLLRHNISLWDVVKSCERQGSLDSNIRNPEINDFRKFMSAHPGIRHVFFNGRKAYDLFEKHVGFEFEGVEFTYLKSTSPAHAIKFQEKLEDWKKVITTLRKS